MTAPAFDDLTLLPGALAGESEGTAQAVGWLEKGRSFPEGDVSSAFRSRLWDLCLAPASSRLEVRECSFCARTDDASLIGRAPKMIGEISVRAGETTFVAPSLIIHYVQEHRYLPPAAFIEAVLDPLYPRGLREALVAVPGVESFSDSCVRVAAKTDLGSLLALLVVLRSHSMGFSFYDGRYLTGAVMDYFLRRPADAEWRLTLGEHGWSGGAYLVPEAAAAAHLRRLAARGPVDITIGANIGFRHYADETPAENARLLAKLAAMPA